MQLTDRTISKHMSCVPSPECSSVTEDCISSESQPTINIEVNSAELQDLTIKLFLLKWGGAGCKCMQMPTEARRGRQIPWSWELQLVKFPKGQIWCQILKSSPLEEQQALLTAQLCPHPFQFIKIYLCVYVCV